MSEGQQGVSNRLLLLYYGFSAVFMLLDYVFDLNLRLTFLDDQPAWRLAWYTLCFACFALIWWRPEWAAWIGLAESLATMSFIILNTALRVVVVSDDMIESGRGAVSVNEILNFVITFGVIYIAYVRQVSLLRRR